MVEYRMLHHMTIELESDSHHIDESVLWLEDGPANLRKAFRATDAKPVKDGWPEPGIFEGELNAEVRDVIPHEEGYWVVTPRAKAILEELIDIPCEYLPAKVVDKKRKEEIDVWVVSPLVEHEALEPLGSNAELVDDELIDLERYVLDAALLEDAPQVFRLSSRKLTIFLRADLCDACQARGLNLPLIEVEIASSDATPEEKAHLLRLAEARRIGWKRACQEGKLEIVELLLSEDDPDLNGDRSECYHEEDTGLLKAPYYTPLGEAARYGHTDILQKLLEAGALVDRLNYRTETALHQALAAGKGNTARMLLEAGSNPNLAGCLGNGVAACRLRLDMVELVLGYGADPTVPDPWGQTAFDFLRFDLNEKIDVGEAKKALAILNKLLTIWPQQHPQYQELSAFVAEASDALMNSKDRKKNEAKKYREMGKPHAGWADAILKLLDGELIQIRETVDKLVEHTLSWEAPIAAPEWRDIVLKLIDLTVDYGDETENAYGERLSVDDMEDDEGGVLDMISDERLCTAEDVFTLLAHPAALARDDFAELFQKMCKVKAERLGFFSFGQDELEALMESEDFKQRPDYEELMTLAKSAYPFL